MTKSSVVEETETSWQQFGGLSIPSEFEGTGALPDQIVGYVSVRSQGGVSILEATELEDTKAFFGDRDDHATATDTISTAGLEILAESPLGKSVVGSADAWRELTGGELRLRERLTYAEAGRQRYVTHIDIVGQDHPTELGVGVARSGDSAIEAVFLERPRIPHLLFPSPIPPSVAKFHLRLPDDVALLLGALPAHRLGHLGEGITVAMVDTGHYRHPFFGAHGYDVRPPIALVPGTDPSKDPVGHGTGESANIFAVAPAATLRPYRASNDAGRLVAAIAGFVRAKQDQPHIISNSWGGDADYPPTTPLDSAERAWALEIQHAGEQGIVVVFSAGNGQFAVEPQVPGVLSAGGVYAAPGMELHASDYASGYQSPWFPGESVPDVCGLVGMLPRAQYLMLPVPSGCEIDSGESQAADGDTTDGTTGSDGWALFSGTSAAAPQVSGACALLLGAHGSWGPREVLDALRGSAIDVRVGHCHPRFNNPAQQGPDLATGSGLVSVAGALGITRKSPPPEV